MVDVSGEPYTAEEAADLVAKYLCNWRGAETAETRVTRIVNLRDAIDDAMLHPSKFALELLEQMKIYASDAVYSLKDDE